MTEQANDKAETNILEAPVDLAEKLPDFVDLLPAPLQKYWHLMDTYPLLEMLSIIILFGLLAFISRWVLTNVIHKLTSKTQTGLDDSIIRGAKGPISYTIFLLGIMFAVNVSHFELSIFKYTSPVVGSILTIVWINALLSLCKAIMDVLVRNHYRFSSVDARTAPLLTLISKIIILATGCYCLLIIWGINPVGLLASAGIVGIAVGFAAKDTLANLFSGMFILADAPYKLGDYINLETGDRGKVTHIGIRSTRILTRDDIEVTIPNGIIGNAKVINESGGPWKRMRARLDVQCAYDADLPQVCDVLMEVAKQQQDICPYPAARVRVRGFADSGINVQLLCWIDEPEDRGRILHELYIAIHNAFKQNGLEIPYPKRDLYLHQRSLEQNQD